MVARVNSAEGGTNGVAVTTSNSGGASGNAWSAISKASGTSVTFATAAAYKGSLGYLLSHGSGSGSSVNLRWYLTGWTKVRARFYLRTASYPTATSMIGFVTDAPNAKILASIYLTTAGKLQVANRNGTVLFTASAAIGLNTWTRVEFIVVPGTTTTNGTVRFAWGSGDAAATDTFASTAAFTGYGGTLGQLYVGKYTGTWNTSPHYDDFAADDASSTTFLGASAAGPTVTDPTPAPDVEVPTWPPPAPYTDVIRSGGYSLEYSVSATFGGEPVAGATDLRPVGGSIVDTARPGVRRTLNLQVAPDPGLYDRLKVEGTLLTVTCQVTYLNQTSVDVPMGVFEVDSVKLPVGGAGPISITAPDKWGMIQRRAFLQPYASTPGISASDQIAILIHVLLGNEEPVSQVDTSGAIMGAQTWEEDSAQAILDIAKDAGLWVYFDRTGVATIADAPTIGATANWLVDASASGVLTELDRERSRTRTYNVVTVTSSQATAEAFPPQTVWDADPNSPTYAGTNPFTAPETQGPFGIIPYFHASPMPLSIPDAIWTAKTILARVTGLASQVSLGMAPNPAVDAGDVLDVLAPEERRDISRVLERHVADTVTHPLTLDGTRVEGRSTRADDL